MKRTINSFELGFVLAMIGAHGTAVAQTASDPQVKAADVSAAQAGTAQEGALNEIIVTANKREQRLQDVGLTIASVDQERLTTQGIATLADIAQAVPSLSYSNSQNNTPVYTLRGVGFYDTSLAAYPTTSVYLDQVPLPFPAMTTLTAFDLERIEVLKGPQGTLFGNNATGGAINFIAAKPTGDLEAGVKLTYGRFDQMIGEFYLSGPLSDTVGARLSGKIARADGWQSSYTRDDRNGRQRNYAGRLLVDWTPTDSLRFELNLNAWQDKSEPQAPQFVQSIPQFAPGNPLIANYPIAPRDNRAADWSPDSPPRSNNRFKQASLRADLDISDSLTLTSLTSWIDYKHFMVVEGDGTQYRGIDLDPIRGKIRSFSQELRIVNDPSAALRWVVGANYSSDKVSEAASNIFGDSSAALTLAIESLTFRSNQRMKNYAGFANVEYDIAPTVTLKAGARYTQADRSGDFCSNDTITGTTNVFFTNLSRLVTGTDVPEIAPSECYALLPSGLPSRTPYEAELNEDNISWRGGVDWKVTPDTLLYANISKGYKAGSFPTLSASSVVQYAPVTQESVLAYEVGFKSRPMGRLLTLNGAVFYYDYADKQLKSRLIDPIFGALDVLQNIPKSSVRGGELELTISPVRGLTIGDTLVYTDAKVDRFIGVNGAGATADFSGAAVPFSPKWRNDVSLEYTTAISDTLDLFAGGNYSYQSKSVSVIGGTGVYKIDGYGLLNLHAGIESESGGWKAFAWGKNVTDKFYTTNVFAGNDEILQFTGRPATYGVTFSISY